MRVMQNFYILTVSVFTIFLFLHYVHFTRAYNRRQVVSTQILLPMLVVLGVSMGCRDVTYPQAELTSSTIDGVGEVCVGVGKGDNIHGNISSNITARAAGTSPKPPQPPDPPLTPEETYGGFNRLQLALGAATLTWRGQINSEGMWGCVGRCTHRTEGATHLIRVGMPLICAVMKWLTFHTDVFCCVPLFSDTNPCRMYAPLLRTGTYWPRITIMQPPQTQVDCPAPVMTARVMESMAS